MAESEEEIKSLLIKVKEGMQNRKRDTDIQNRLLDSVGEGKGGMF